MIRYPTVILSPDCVLKIQFLNFSTNQFLKDQVNLVVSQEFFLCSPIFYNNMCAQPDIQGSPLVLLAGKALTYIGIADD